MKELKVRIANKEYLVQTAQTDEEKEKGLQNVSDLPQDKGMLFIYDEPDEVSFWMKDTQIPLDVIFIDEELNVISVHQGVPMTETPMSENNVAYVLEVNPNSGVKSGDELEFSPEMKTQNMHVLGSNGNTQMELEGGERIFSRPNTKSMIKYAKKANISQKDNDYKKLGETLFKFLQGQDDRPVEHVELKN